MQKSCVNIAADGTLTDREEAALRLWWVDLLLALLLVASAAVGG